MLCEKVVPNGNRALAPTKAAGEFGPCGVLLDLIENWAALRFSQTIETRDVERVEEQGYSTREGMSDDRRMSPLGVGLRIAPAHLD